MTKKVKQIFDICSELNPRQSFFYNEKDEPILNLDDVLLAVRTQGVKCGEDIGFHFGYKCDLGISVSGHFMRFEFKDFPKHSTIFDEKIDWKIKWDFKKDLAHQKKDVIDFVLFLLTEK